MKNTGSCAITEKGKHVNKCHKMYHCSDKSLYVTYRRHKGGNSQSCYEKYDNGKKEAIWFHITIKNEITSKKIVGWRKIKFKLLCKTETENNDIKNNKTYYLLIELDIYKVLSIFQLILPTLQGRLLYRVQWKEHKLCAHLRLKFLRKSLSSTD